MPDLEPIKIKVEVEYDGSGLEKAKEDIQSLNDAGDAGGEQLGGLGGELDNLGEKARQTASDTAALAKAIEESGKPVEELNSALSDSNEILDEHSQAIEDTNKAYEELPKKITETNAAVQESSDVLPIASKNLEEMNNNLNQMKQVASDSANVIPEFNSNLQDLTDSAVNANKTFQELNNLPPGTVLQFDNQGRLMASSAQYFADASEQVVQSTQDITQSVEKASTPISTLQRQIEEAGKAAREGPFSNFIPPQAIDNINQANSALNQSNDALDKWNGFLDDVFKGPASEIPSIGESIGSAWEGMSEFFSGGALMQGMMIAQMAGMAIDQAGQQIYNMAAIAEGPAAHSMGSFTGTVDALTQSAQRAGQQFSESYGQQIMPALNAMNYQLNQNQDFGGGGVGMISDTVMNLGNLEMSGVALMMGMPGLAWNLFAAGGEGLINQGAQTLGLPQPFQGPGPQQQSQIDYQQQFAQLPQAIDKLTEQTQIASDTYLAEASSPEYLAAQQTLPFAQQAYQEAQIRYNSQHPLNDSLGQYGSMPVPQALLMSYQAQQYDAQQSALYNQAIASQGPLDGYYLDFSKGIPGALGRLFQNSSGQQNLYGGGTRPPSTPFDNNILGSLGDWFQNNVAFAGGPGGWGGQTYGQAIGGWFSNLFGGLFGGNPQTPSPVGGCFIAGTSILMSDGSERAIETLQIGERVLAHDGTTRIHAVITDCLVFPAKQTYELTFSNGTTLHTTDSHPISTTRGWRSIDPASTALENPDLSVSRLQVGDEIHTANGSTCHLLSIKKREIETVYNITVSTSHTYYANKILVHNAKGAMTASGTGTEQVTLAHTFTASVTWEAQNLQKSFTAAAQWAAQNLVKSVVAAAQWAESNLVHTAIAAAQWAESNLVHMATAAAQWAESNLTHMATAAAEWAEQNLTHAVTAMAQWADQNLVHPVTAMAQWAEQGLEHTFKGVANWIGEGLEHTFNAVANWTAQNLTPSFTVNPSVTMLADGTSNWPGGPAIVGEAGAELVEHNGNFSLFDQGAAFVNLPAGSNVYPMRDVSYQPSAIKTFADGTGGTIPISFGMTGGDIVVHLTHITQLDGRTIAQQVVPYSAPIIRQMTGRRR
jgi:ABC-type transporter Mla subunit MlaD